MAEWQSSRPTSMGVDEIEAADDFILSTQALLNSATFTGLIPSGCWSVSNVTIEIYRVFPLDSTDPPSISYASEFALGRCL